MKYLALTIVALAAVFVISSCRVNKDQAAMANFNYQAFKDSLHIENYDASADTANLFDAEAFTPAIDSFDKLLVKIDTLWKLELDDIARQDKLKKLAARKEIYTIADREVIHENLRVLDSFLIHGERVLPADCRRKECVLYAEVVKPRQKLYLYLEGELVDSFKVSTGVKGYETPDIDRRPSGPLFIRYTSRKFPGGNYQGLGNMPYAVFIRGGYAIHGTTVGNFSRLGTTASHGCIRLHPNNAKIFYELVKRVGLQNTWVTITSHIPAQEGQIL